VSKAKAEDPKSTPAKPTVAEVFSPYAYYGVGPRLQRLTTWEPERWQERDPAPAGLPLLTRESMRFHTWKDRGIYSVSCAYYAAKDMARGNLSRGNFLVLSGPTGTGKTHLAMAIAWEWFEDGFNVLFTRVDDLIDWLRQGYEDGTYHKRLDSVRRRHLLILDDLGEDEQDKAWAGERLDRIVDWRHLNRLPLIVTTNAFSEDLAERVASRLADKSCSLTITIDAVDFRTEEE